VSYRCYFGFPFFQEGIAIQALGKAWNLFVSKINSFIFLKSGTNVSFMESSDFWAGSRSLMENYDLEGLSAIGNSTWLG
jgi:hypothetical protein